MGTTYISWGAGFPARLKAEDAHAELEKIRAANGGDISAPVVVKSARKKRSPLHDQVFDKDIPEAAEEYYLGNARKMIRSLIITRDEGKNACRAYSVVGETQSDVSPSRVAYIYGSTEEAMEDPGRRAYILAAAKRDMESFIRRYGDIKHLAKVIRVMKAHVA